VAVKNDSVSALLLHTRDACVHKAPAWRDAGCVDWPERIAWQPHRTSACIHAYGWREKQSVAVTPHGASDIAQGMQQLMRL